MLTRRDFSKLLLVSGAAGLPAEAAWAQVQSKASGIDVGPSICELLIKGGTVIDPGQRLHATLDVAVGNGKILEVAKDIPENRAGKVVRAHGKIVTPGFIDLQVHCFEGISDIAINADHYCLGRGVTTIVENGAAGYLGIDGYIKYIIDPAVTRIYTSLNIFPPGIIRPDVMKSLDSPDAMNPELAAKAVLRSRPAVVGIKAYIEKAHVGPNDVACLDRSLRAAAAAKSPSSNLCAGLTRTQSCQTGRRNPYRSRTRFKKMFCGQAIASEMGYTALPSRIVVKAEEALSSGR